MPPASRATTRAISPQSAGCGTSAGRGYPKQRCRKGGHPPSTFSRLVSRTRERGRSPVCLMAATVGATSLASGFRRVYPSAVWTAHTADHDGHSGAYRNAAGSEHVYRRKPEPCQTSLLQSGAYSRAALEDGAGTGGDARRGQIGCTATRVCLSPLCSPFRLRPCSLRSMSTRWTCMSSLLLVRR